MTSAITDLAANATTVTINGFGFDTTAAHNTVVFNDGAVGSDLTFADGKRLFMGSSSPDSPDAARAK